MTDKSSIAKRMKINQKLFIFVFFLTISTVFWFLNALNKEYATEISYPINFNKLPTNKILSAKSSKQLILKIYARGFTILKHKLSREFLPIELDYSLLPVLQFSKNNPNTLYIKTQTVKDLIISQLSSEIKVVEIMPDTLFLNLTETRHKKVPVKFEGQLEFEKQFMQQDLISFLPDCVTVIGPGTELDSIYYIETVPIHILGLNKSVVKTVQLKNTDEVQITPQLVTINIPVEKYTESSITLPIEIQNLPTGLNMKTFPNKVMVSFIVGFSNFDKISVDKFKAVIDYNSIQDNRKKLKIRIIKYPEFIHTLNLNPETVEYIIEK